MKEEKKVENAPVEQKKKEEKEEKKEEKKDEGQNDEEDHFDPKHMPEGCAISEEDFAICRCIGPIKDNCRISEEEAR